MANPVNIEILQLPPKFSLIGEGLFYRVQSKRDWLSAKALVTLVFPDSAASAYTDKYFELTFMDQVIKFYFKTMPDESGTQLRTRDAGDSSDEFLQKIIEDLKKNYYINKYYSIEYVADDHEIDINAREHGARYNIEMTDSDITGIVFTHIDALATTQPNDYKIYIAAMLPGASGTDPQIAGEDMVAIDSQQIAEDDIADLLESQLETGFTWPFNVDKIIEWPKGCIQFFANVAEYFDGSVKMLFKAEGTNGNYVLPGSVTKEYKQYIQSEGGKFYFDINDNQSKFLTWAPNNKYTFTTVPEKLYIILQNKGLFVEYKGYFKDGTTITITETIPSINLPGIIEIFCGADIIFDGYNKDDLVSYDVYIKDSSGLKYSEVRSFKIDQNYYLNIRTILFKNSFGMYDAAHFTGDLSVNDNLKSTVFTALTNNEFIEKIFEKSNRDEYKLSSGYLPDESYRQWYEDLLLSKDAYLVIGDYALPIIIKPVKSQKSHDRDDLHSLTIIFMPAYENEFYSKPLEETRFVLVDENDDYIATENDTLFKTI